MEGREGEHTPCLGSSCRSIGHELNHDDVFNVPVLLLIRG
ncbi:hypothetical protein HMPREF9153_2000 [Cutibacterium avidum ATCC 25577]|uniref:Uncharacterized protein n=1 Tax=Cutibacterium avidum ATCC 25577 TaxID=997355 RepID=G4CZX8_9ACTN|nr:hypothetical protein HMPREF9153_2000 [Cutibacterium avidum ATCC 25577]